ncbi:MAG: hypothetical protein KA314_00655 [Chloroflexi bacterium]|nr:hypothetical protein [Chloroflexota bacterium]MBP8054316.1 hypothetical protein [Chloroflexota bacterium]
MNYGIARVNKTQNCAQYHLFDHRQQLILVADYGSPWVPPHQVRLARPDGQPVASLTLPRPALTRFRRQTSNLASYALVIENAVHAVINRLQPSTVNQSEKPYYIIEVESQKWLALGEPEGAERFALYSTVPPRLAFIPLRQVPLPAAVGTINPMPPDTLPYDFAITVEPGRLKQLPLLLLCLVFLMEHNPA